MPPAASSQTSLPSHTGPMARKHGAALVVGARDEQMDDAGAQIEAVEHHVRREHDGDNAEPERCHRSSDDEAISSPRASLVTGSRFRIRAVFNFAIHQEQEQNRQHGVHPHEAEQREQPLPAETVLEYPSAVRIRP